MKWLDRLERKFRKFAIKGLMLYIVSLNLAVFLLSMFNQTDQLVNKLTLVPDLVMKGEVWRLVTYIFIPPLSPNSVNNIIFIIFVLYFYYMMGTSLEHEWGSFKFNMYYLIGMVSTTIIAFATGGSSTGMYLNLSIFLAFARIYPNYEILLFFILPIKVKYLAWVDWAFFAYTIIAPTPIAFKLAAAAALINYFLFFGKDIFISLKSGRSTHYNRKNYNYKLPKDYTIHKCTICGITEKDKPNMDFRYCSKCEGAYEYCMDHLSTHVHKLKG